MSASSSNDGPNTENKPPVAGSPPPPPRRPPRIPVPKPTNEPPPDQAAIKQAHTSRLQIGKPDKGKGKEELTHTLVTIAPDGGWGWVILAICTWDCLCIDGVSLGYSVVQQHVTDRLQITGVQSSMFVSVFNCFVYLLGPVTAAVANRFGFKILNIVGGFLGGVSLAVCYWSNQFILSIICFAGLSGIGGSMIYMVSMACPGYWFETRRSLAFGVSNSATGIACLILPPIFKSITTISVDEAWRLVFIALSAMLFVAFIIGFLIRKPPMMLVEAEGYVPPTDDKYKAAAMSMSILNVRGGGQTQNKLQQLSTHANVHKSVANYPRQLSDPSVIITKTPFWRKCCNKENQDIKIERPLYKSDIFLTSKVDIATKVKLKNQADYTMSIHKMTTERDIREQLEDQCVCCPEAVRRPLKEMLDVSLFKNFVYLIMLVDTMLYYSAIYVTYLFVPRTALRKGLGEDTGILILQLFGGFMALSRICIGGVFYLLPNMPPHYFTFGNVVLGGLCQASLCFTTNKIVLYVLGSLTGFFCGVWVPMRSVLVVRYIGLEKLTNAMGMLFVFQAIGSLYGAPVAEAIATVFNEDYMTIYFAGVMYASAGALIFPLEIIHNCTHKKEKQSV